MAIPRSEKTVYLNSPEREVNYIGAAFDVGTPCVLSGQNLVSINPSDHETEVFDCGNNNMMSCLSNTYYYPHDNSVTFDNLLIRGTAFSSIDAFINALFDKFVTEIITANTTGSIYSFQHTQFASKQQGYYASSPGGEWYRPYITMSCSQNQFNPGDLSRTYDMEIRFDLARANWDSTNLVWGNNTWGLNTRIFYSGASGNDWNDAISIKDRFIDRCKKMRLAIGPGFGIGSTWGDAIRSDIWAYVYVDNDPPLADNLYPYAMRIVPHGYIQGSNWTINGEVDPTPPEPEPEPEPYPPTPPIPPTPDPPVPVDPVDPVPIPTDPPLGEVGIGFVTVYNPDKYDLNQLARKFWDQTLWDILKQHFINPFDAILGLTIIPVTPDRVAGQPLVIGNYNTNIETNKVTSEYATLNCGNVYIPKFFNSYLDYDPYTKYQLFLPFIGEVALNADEITSKTINITYKVNVITGDCVAFLSINNSVFAEYNGNCARQVTVTKGNLEEILKNAVQFAASVATMGLASAATGSIGDAIESTATNSAGELSGSGQVRLAGVEARMSSMNANTISAGVNAVLGSKMSYSKSGNPGQGSGQISVRTPFITVTRPNLTLPENIDQASQSSLRRYVGYPTNRIGPLSSFHGVTIVEACQLSSQHATDGEIAEALEIMKGGVIL